MPRINKTQYALLGLIEKLGPSSGYDLKRFIDKSIGYFWQENYGHIYPVLGKMVDKGYLTCTVEPSVSPPTRKVYAITDEGTAVVRKWRLSPLEPMPFKSELLLRIFFTPEEEKESIIEMLREERARQIKLFEEYTECRTCEEEAIPLIPLLTVMFGEHRAEFIIKWCDEALTLLQEDDR